VAFRRLQARFSVLIGQAFSRHSWTFVGTSGLRTESDFKTLSVNPSNGSGLPFEPADAAPRY
jgi:hypothetical protein